MLYQNSKQKELNLKIRLITDVVGFSEFTKYEFEDDLYLFFGSLGSYTQYCIDNNKFVATTQIFNLVNDLLIEINEIEFENMILTQIFEMLYDKKEYFDIGYKNLNEKGRNLLLSIKDNFYPFNNTC